MGEGKGVRCHENPLYLNRAKSGVLHPELRKYQNSLPEDNLTKSFHGQIKQNPHNNIQIRILICLFYIYIQIDTSLITFYFSIEFVYTRVCQDAPRETEWCFIPTKNNAWLTYTINR